MATYIQNLLANAIGDGARATRFDVEIHFANPMLASSRDINTVIKTTQFPSKTLQKMDIMYKGRAIPIKGQVKYNQAWNATFYLGEDHKLKNAFEIWLEALDQQHNYSNTSIDVLESQSVHSRNGYTSTIKLYQTAFDGGDKTACYTLYNAFPTEITELEYSSENVGTVQEFTVMFAYSHYSLSVTKGGAGNFVDEMVSGVRGKLQDVANKIMGR
jgi:hypothetical protein